MSASARVRLAATRLVLRSTLALARGTLRQPAGEIITAEATGAGRLDPLGIDGIGPPEAVDEGGEAEEDILRQRLGHELAQREHDVGFEAPVQHLLQPGEARVAPDLEPEGEPGDHGIRQEMPAREAAVDDRMQSGQRRRPRGYAARDILAQIAHEAAHGRLQQRFLAVEIVIDQPRREAGMAPDGGQGRVLQPAFGDGGDGGLDQLVAPKAAKPRIDHVGSVPGIRLCISHREIYCSIEQSAVCPVNGLAPYSRPLGEECE